MVGFTFAFQSGSASILFSLPSAGSSGSAFQVRKPGWLLACLLIHDHSSLRRRSLKKLGRAEKIDAALPRHPRIVADPGVRQQVGRVLRHEHSYEVHGALHFQVTQVQATRERFVAHLQEVDVLLKRNTRAQENVIN